MKIIVIGCGKIGQTVVASLVSEGQDVIAVDLDAETVTAVTNIYDVIGVCGNGADCEVLKEAGAAEADLLVAVTGSDESNMLCCFFAKRLGAKHTIARIRNPEYNENSLGFMCQQLDLAMAINPELLAAKEIYNMLRLPFAATIETFSRGYLEMIEMRLKQDSPLSGVKIIDLRSRFKANFLVTAVRRGDDIYIPDGNFELKSGDKIGLVASHDELTKLIRALGLIQRQARNIMILGGSRTAYYLARMLSGSGNAVKIVEKDRQTCLELCEALPGTDIICGDGAEQELLLEEGIRGTDAFVSLTGMDEENILISIFASSLSVPKVIPKVNKEELIAMAEKLGVDSIISPKKTISDLLIRYVRALLNSEGSNVETLYKVMDGKAEALEFSVRPGSEVANIPLKDLELKKNILVAGIIRERETIIPGGSDMILAGDRVVVIASDKKLGDLSDILK